MNKLIRIHSIHQSLVSLLAIVLSLLALHNASASTEHWIGLSTSATTNWTTAANWSSPQQTYFNNVDFYTLSGGSPTNNFSPNNYFDAATGVAQMPAYALRYYPTNNYTTLVAPGLTLATGAGNAGNQLLVGADQVSGTGPANTNETVTITGAGAKLSIGGGAVRVGQGGPAGSVTHYVTLDLSGLDAFLMDNSLYASKSFSSRFILPGGGPARSQGAVYFAKTNVLNLGNDFEIGYMGSYTNTLPVGAYLGLTNAIITGNSGASSDTVTVGSKSCTNAFLKFNPNFIGGANPPASAYFYSPASVNGGRVNNFYICNNGAAGATPAYGYCDFTGGYVNIMASTMALGVGSTTAGMSGTGVLTFDNGIVDVNNLGVGTQVASAGGAGIGIINMSTNCTLKVNNTLGLAVYTGTPTAGDAGTLNMNGGTLIANLITNGAGTGTINMTNATWQVVITPGVTAPANATVTNFNTGGATNLISLTFASLPSTYPVTNRLIKYQNLGGVGIANMGISLPSGGGYAGSLVINNTADGAIDLVLTNGASPSALVWTGTDPGASPNWDGSALNWTNMAGTAVAYNQLDAVRFDDTASGPTAPILVGSLTPSGLTVSNAAKSYTFGGTGWLAGAGVTGGAIPGGLVKQSTGTLILNNTTADTYLGGITIAAGVLQVGDGSTSGGGSLGPASGAVANSGGLVVNRPSGDIFAVGNIISGAGGITNAGLGTLQLNSANTFTGPVAVNAGTVQLGNGAALGTTAGATYVGSSATLDFNGINPGAEPITAQGIGTDGNGALINNNSAGIPQPTAVTLSGNIVLGGSARWDLHGTLSSGGNAYNITIADSAPNYSMEWRDLAGDSALGNITVNSGTIFGWAGSTTAGTSGMLTVSGTMKLYNTTPNANVTKPLVLNESSTIVNGGGANVISSSITFNGTSTFNIGTTSLTLSGALLGSGTLYKQNNSAPLYITGNSPSFSGNVWNYSGKIYLNGILGSGSSSITTQPGTFLAGTGTNNGPVDIYGTYTPGDSGVLGTNTFGALTLEGSAMMTNDLAATASGASDLIRVNGDLALNNATIYINPIGSILENRPYTLITYTGTLTTSLPAVQTVSPSLYTLTLSNATSLTPKQIQVVVTGGTPDLLVWDNAGNNGEWDAGSSPNWSNTTSHGSSEAFYSGDAVLFNDSITNASLPATNIDIMGGVIVAPSVMTNNSTLNWGISGGGTISGGGAIYKMGPGTLAISNANDFTGPITISGGTLVGASGAALGATNTGSITITNGGTLDAGYPLAAKAIVVSGAGVGGQGAIVNNNTAHIYGSVGGLASTVTLMGDTTFGGTNRWDLSSATLSTGGKPYSVSVTGPQGAYREWQSLTIDPALTNINILTSELGVKGMNNLGDPNGTVTIYSNGCLTFWGGSNYTKNYYVKAGGTNQVRQTGPVFNLNMTLEGGAIFHSLDNAKVMTGPVNLLGPVTFLCENATCTFSNVISGVGGVVWSGINNQFVFAAANTYQGQTIIGSGLTLALLGNGSISNSSLIFFGGTDTNAFRIDATGRGDQTLTLASGQLEGAGRVNGALTVSTNATVAPGTNITFGAIGASGAVTLNGTTTLKIYNPTANDAIQSSTSIAYGGTLNLEFLTGNLAAGNSWKLFNAPIYSGSFTLSPASPGAGLIWDTSRLDIDGTLRVISTTPPDITGITVGGGNVVLSGTNGSPNAYYSVLSTTNVALPLTNWQSLTTNQFDGGGNFNWTNAINPGETSRFYRVQLQ